MTPTTTAIARLSESESDERFMRELAAGGDIADAASRIREALSSQATDEVGNDNLWADLVQAALSQIDYLEFAQALRES